MSDTTTIPSTPDPQQIVIWAGYLRTFLAGLAAIGVAVPVLSDAKLSIIATALIELVSLLGWAGVGLWSRWQKFQAARANHAGNVASAAAGKPVEVVTVAPK